MNVRALGHHCVRSVQRHRPLLVLALAILAGCSHLSAQEAAPQFDHFVSYEQAVPTGLICPAPDLVWLNQVFDLMNSQDFTFIYRKDTDHWAGIYRQGQNLLLHIHNTDAQFNVRLGIDRQSGAIKLLRGVIYQNRSDLDSSRISGQTAIAWLEYLLASNDYFGAGAAVKAVVAQNGGSSSSMASSRPAARIASKPSLSPHLRSSPPPKATTVLPLRSPVLGIGSLPLGINSSDALTRLLEGNRRFVSGLARHPNQSNARRTSVAMAQHPFSIIVTCSDSRVPPEIIFDQGLGDLFVVRTAGEVLGDLEMGSIDYALEHLNVGHILVLGHQHCGAVEATLKGGEMPENILRVTMQIQSAVDAVRGRSGDPLENAIRQNALNIVGLIRASAIAGELLQEKLLTINAGYYDLKTGRVSIID